MTARFLVRFDDICPTLNWRVWRQVESILERHDVKPMLAVVPDNRDARLMVEPPNPDFWQRVRGWQAKGWTIAIHGYQHAYVTNNPGIVGLNSYSEFAGLPHLEQKQKIESALSILSRENVAPQAWVAPAHAFDETTVQVLIDNGVQVISDGFYFRPVKKLGATWIPQQLWKFRRLPAGLWTVCYHSNQFSEDSIARLDADLQTFRSLLVSLPDVLARYPAQPETFMDATFSKLWLWTLTRRSRR
jgi:predicted deacetylase